MIRPRTSRLDPILPGRCVDDDPRWHPRCSGGRRRHRRQPLPRGARRRPARRRPAHRAGDRRRPGRPGPRVRRPARPGRADPDRPRLARRPRSPTSTSTPSSHLALVTAPDPQQGGRSAMKEQNVIGTMQLLAACQRAPRLRKLVVRSSTAAYGASFRDPAVFTEETEPREVPRGGFGRDILDIEGYVRGFRRRRPDVTATVLRFAPFIGSDRRHHADPLLLPAGGARPCSAATPGCSSCTSTTRSRCCTGRSPRTTRARTTSPGRACSSLSQAIRRAGRVGRPGARAGPVRGRRAAPATSASAGYGLDQVDLFVHGRVVDTSRLAREFGFTPAVHRRRVRRLHPRPPRRGRGQPGPARRRRAGGARRHPPGPRRRREQRT